MTAVRRIIDRLTTKRITEREIYRSTIRPSDEAMKGRYVQRPFAALCARYYSPLIYAAVSRTAAAVAAMPLKVGRQVVKGNGTKSCWASKAIGTKARDHYAATNGSTARKSMADNDSIEEVIDPNHPLVMLLNKWNIRDNGFDGIERVVQGLELTGNAYPAMIAGRSVPYPVELWPLHPPWVHAVPSREAFISAYIYGKGTEVERTYDPSDICHLRYPNPTGDEIYGMGTLAAAVQLADLSSAYTAHGLATIENGVQPGLVISMPGSRPEQREEARVELERVYQGPAQAGRSLIIGGPDKMSVMPWVIGQKESAYLESGDNVRDKIAMVWGIPTAMLTMENAALATAEAAIPQWRTVSLIPRSRRIEDGLNASLMEKFRAALNDPTLFVYFDTTDKEDSDKVSVRMVAEYAGGLRTKNEARVPLDLPTVPDGDEFKTEPVPMGGVAPDGEPIEAEVEEEDEPEEAEEKTLVVYERSIVPTIKASDLVMGKGANLCRCGDCTIHTKDDRGSEVVTMEERIRKVLTSYEGVILAAIRSGEPLEKVLIREGFPTQLADEMLPSIREMFTRGYSAGNAKIGKRPSLGAFAVQNPEAEQFMRGEAARLASSVTRTFSQTLADTVANGIRDGLSTTQIAEGIQGTMPTMNAARAEMIARTETARAYTNGNINAWERSGEVEGKEWLLAADACEFCKTVAREFKTVGLRDNFLPKGVSIVGTDGGVMVIDYTAIPAPPLHPNCVLPDTQIMGGTVVAGIRAAYSGNVVTVRTASGRVLTVTENHNLLSASGFVRASSIKNGDHLVCACVGETSLCPDMNNRPVTAAEVFRTLSLSGSVSPGGVPAAPEYLHGDGISVDGEIEVVWADSLLGSEDDSACPEHFGECGLNRTDILTLNLPSPSHLDSVLTALRLTAYGFVGGGGLVPALLWGEISHPDVRGLGPIALNSPALPNPADNCSPVKPETLREFVDGLTGMVALDEVVSVDVWSYSGPVHDFSTVSGAYICNGIVSHNCRCDVAPVMRKISQ